jgi:hypothetical protein
LNENVVFIDPRSLERISGWKETFAVLQKEMALFLEKTLLYGLPLNPHTQKGGSALKKNTCRDLVVKTRKYT